MRRPWLRTLTSGQWQMLAMAGGNLKIRRVVLLSVGNAYSLCGRRPQLSVGGFASFTYKLEAGQLSRHKRSWVA
jgi:hypothetical protein